ncbi:hypothetical protein [Butyrivibrio sp. AE3004]|uniref:hypothetical protein n=1 Tax=Butyrivibrio sp. AE3004 TaxID=1506994 RepID=UPI000494B2A7|nr:hypothetical protein [Butyrivibrio sp. AE3004]
MKKNKKIWAYALAGALAISNLSVVATPFASIVAQAGTSLTANTTYSTDVQKIQVGVPTTVTATTNDTLGAGDKIQIVLGDASGIFGITSNSEVSTGPATATFTTTSTAKVGDKAKIKLAATVAASSTTKELAPATADSDDTLVVIAPNTTSISKGATNTVVLGSETDIEVEGACSSVTAAPLTDAQLAAIKSGIKITGTLADSITLTDISALSGTGNNGKFTATFTVNATDDKRTSSDSATITFSDESNSGSNTASVSLSGESSATKASKIAFYTKDDNGKLIVANNVTKRTAGANIELNVGVMSGSKVVPFKQGATPKTINKDTTDVTTADPAGTTAITYVVADTSVATLTTSGAEHDTPTLTPKKAGKTKVTAKYTIKDAIDNKVYTSTADIDVEIIALPAATTGVVIYEKGTGSAAITKKITAGAFDNKDTTAYNLVAEASNTTITPGQNFAWVSANPDVIALSDDTGVATTVTAKGNSSSGINVYAFHTDTEAWIKYANSKKDAAALATLLSSTTDGTDRETVSFTSTGYTDKIALSKESVDVVVDKSEEVTASTNNTSLSAGATASETKVVYSATSADKTIATAEVDTATGKITIKGVKAGSTTIDVKGEYKVRNSTTNKLESAEVTGTINVKVIDPNAADKAKADAIDAADKAADAAVADPTADKIKAANDAVVAAKALGATDDELKSVTEKVAKAEAAKEAAEKKAADEAAKKAADEKAAAEEAAKKSDGSTAGTPAPINSNLKDANGTETGFVVTNATAGAAEVKLTAAAVTKGASSYTIPATVKDASGNDYKVTSIDANAFAGSDVKTVTIGANVKSIDPAAFASSSVKKINIKGAKLTQKMANSLNKAKKGTKVKVTGKNKKANIKKIKKTKAYKKDRIKLAK